jgi:hypothetical protein
MEHNSDFRFDLELGKLKGETAFHKMLSEKKIEVKYDRQAKETGNLFIEYMSRGKLSGIATTKADYYAYYISDDFCIVISVKKLKEKMKKLYKENKAKKILGGDKNTSKGLLVKIQDFIT